MSFVSRLKTHFTELFRLAVPVVVARAGVMTMGFVDTVMVGHFSTSELAYQGLGLAPVATVLVTMLGLLMGTLVVTANAFGTKNFAECGAVWRRSLPYALGLGLFGMLLGLGGEAFLSLTGQSPDLAAGGGAVIMVLGLGLPGNMLYVASSFFLEGIKRPMPAMLLMILANLLNLLLNWVFVFGHWGFEPMGAVGSAWATSIVRTVLGLALCAFIWCMRDHDLFAVRRAAIHPWRDGAPQRRIGYAAGVSIGMETAAFSALSLFAGWLGPLPLAAFSIALNLVVIAFMVAVGLASATAVRVSIAHGQGDVRDVAWAGWTGLAANSLAMLALGLLFALFPDRLAATYSAEPELLLLAVPLVAFGAYMLVVDGGQTVMANALRSRDDNLAPTLLHGFSYLVVMLPLCWLLAFPLGRGAMGLMQGILVASIVSFTILSGRFWWLARRDIRASR